MQGVQPKAKGQANAIGSQKAHRLRMVMVARFPVQQVDFEQPDEMQTHKHDDNAGYGSCHIHIITDDRDCEAYGLPECLAKHRRAGSQHDKHRRKSEHEKQRRKKCPPLLGNGGAIPIGQLIKSGPRNEAEVGWHQRQNTGAQKTDGTRQERRLQGNM